MTPDQNFHILIVDDTPENLQLLAAVLAEHGYQIHAANTGHKAVEIAGKVFPDLILLDIMMPGLDGFETCRKLKSSLETDSIPVIFLTAKTDTEDLVKGFNAGAVDYIAKPFRPVELLARVRTHLALRQKEKELLQFSKAVEQSPSSIFITNLEGNIEYVNPKFTQLTGYSYEESIGKNARMLKSESTSPTQYKALWETISRGEVWRGEFRNQKKNGEHYWEFASISPIKDKKGKFTHYIAIEEDITERKKLEALLARQTQELILHKRELEAKNRELETLSVTDQLTGLFNRRYLEQKAEELIHRCERFREDLAMLLLDIDHFKSVNDSYGHDTGDRVLQAFADILRNNSRKVDVIGRWGGEEFMILVQLDALHALAYAEKIQKAITRHHHPQAGRITSSIGVTQYVAGDSMDSMTKRADQALYTAKANGRNRVEKSG